MWKPICTVKGMMAHNETTAMSRTYPIGDPVLVVRSSGQREEGWIVGGWRREGEAALANVYKVEGTRIITKTVAREQLLSWNSVH